MKIIKQGRIGYDISIIIPDDTPEIRGYSNELWRKILRYNIPETKEVIFDGKNSATRSTDTDFGYKSKTYILRKDGSNRYRYFKEMPYFSLYIYIIEQMPSSDEYFPSRVELLDEYLEIHGFKCRKAKVETASAIYIIYFTDAFKVSDRTGAVLQHEGVNGFILMQDEIPFAKETYYYLRHTVRTIDFDTPIDMSVFNIPAGFRHFANTDQVRKANREFMEEDSQNEWKLNPLTEAQKNIFTGNWALDSRNDKIEVNVKYSGSAQHWENKYSFTTKTYTVNNSSDHNTTVEDALLWKNHLLVEDPPNYRLYSCNDQDDSMRLEGNDIFIFRRIT